MTTTGTPIARTATAISTETSTTNRRGAVATHAEICAMRSRSPACSSGAQCSAPSAVSLSRALVIARQLHPSAGPVVGPRSRAEAADRFVAQGRDRGRARDVPVALVVDVVADHAAARASER